MKYPLFARNDLNAFWALFDDNLANLLIISAVCRYIFQMPGKSRFPIEQEPDIEPAIPKNDEAEQRR